MLLGLFFLGGKVLHYITLGRGLVVKHWTRDHWAVVYG